MTIVDMTSLNHTFTLKGFDDTKWSKASSTETTFADGLAAKEALPITLRTIPAASFTILEQTVDESGDPLYHYVIDYGKNFQGHVNISFVAGKAGQQVTVALGEQLKPDGTVPVRAESGNHWFDTWTLMGTASSGSSGGGSGSGSDPFVPHEYCEFRWAEVTGAPEPPSHSSIFGWQVHYPFDGQLNEDGVMAVHPLLGSSSSSSDGNHADHTEGATAGDNDVNVGGLTQFNASDTLLLQVWDLVQHTVDAGAIDLNTDSNTRQRDLCTLDAWVATRYQAGVAPGVCACVCVCEILSFQYSTRVPPHYLRHHELFLLYTVREYLFMFLAEICALPYEFNFISFLSLSLPPPHPLIIPLKDLRTTFAGG